MAHNSMKCGIKQAEVRVLFFIPHLSELCLYNASYNTVFITCTRILISVCFC